MGTEMVLETSGTSNHLTWLIAWEDFMIRLCISLCLQVGLFVARFNDFGCSKPVASKWRKYVVNFRN
jgi:hypothetical protein